MTGAKVFRLHESYDSETVVESSPSLRPFDRQAIRLSDLYYEGLVRFRKELRTVYLCSPQQGTLWTGPGLAAKLAPDILGRRPKVNPGNGIHAYHSLRAAAAANYDPAHQPDHPGKQAVYAIVRPEGQVVVGEYGWVAEAATIVRIYLWPESYVRFSRMLYDRYHVLVEVLPRSLREFPAKPEDRTPAFEIWNRRYAPESGAILLWSSRLRRSGRWKLWLPRAVRRPSNLAVWDPVVAAWSALRLAAHRMMTAQDWGRLGGLARARRKDLPVSGSAVPRPTPCRRCGLELPSAREAWRHCRTGKPGRPKKSLTR